MFDPKEQRQRDRSGTFTGRDGITIFGTGNSEASQQAAAAGSGSGGIGVNAYLWRGALETINFMPLASADPFGGLIITDWYQPAGLTDERLKVHVLILDRSLRADGVKVSVFRQLRDARGDWVDEPVDAKTVGRARGQDPDQGPRAAHRRSRDHRLSIRRRLTRRQRTLVLA